ncbi:DNA cytosine methyltransferase [Burkholderia multivorans]|uniref:DNA cytosine methyltransferase n=1 Tax=Burkholderia multivorans TaxID=87883 RepID=UPI000CFE549D|nr:DNA cytosine methyltransferase [Burkholderia multivorans]PRF87235.1 DNA (cytosine-5-)-methyltransferase [Burkholderia multivorans]
MGRFYEFFAGGGMARAGLGDGWQCLFANDFDHKKGATYRQNWGEGELLTGDVRQVKPANLPGRANLIWGSFPCQDLSLAGAGAGLKGDRSGTFWPFFEVVKGLIADNRAPDIIALENVVGTLHSHEGKDFAAICTALDSAGYRFGAMVIDAALFVPQSRPRLFVVGIRTDLPIPDSIVRHDASPLYHPKALLTALDKLTAKARKSWVWWHLPTPEPRKKVFADLIEENPTGVKWHTSAETQRLLAMMSDVNLAKVEKAKKASKSTGRRMVGAIYRRTRRDEEGNKVQRAEVRFDDVAGCLRTPSGGSSRQLIMVVDGSKVRTRLISSRETARLMGLPDEYELPENYNEAYHLTGDGVAVPVVRHIAANLFEPILAVQPSLARAAA